MEEAVTIYRERFDFYKTISQGLVRDGLTDEKSMALVVDSFYSLTDLIWREIQKAKKQGIHDNDPRLDGLANLTADIFNHLSSLGIETPYWNDDTFKINQN